MNSLFYLLYLILFLANSQNKVQNPSSFIKEENEFETEIDSLMSMMTLEEKIGQTVLYTSTTDITGSVLDKNYLKYLGKGKVGAIFNATGSAFTRKLQKIAVEETRLGIPLIFGYDVIHGYKTIFPIPLGESSSWDLKLIEKTARIAAIEASVEGIHWTFAPMIDIARDPRWGRIAEGAGEDAYLGSKIAKARIQGFQGNNLSDKNTLLACAKHYAAYGAAQAGRDYHTVDMSMNTLHNVYLPPFKTAVDIGVATFMTSFNEVNGVPATGNKFLLDDVLRKQWGFDGFVVTDYTSINEMVHHGYAKDLKHAGELAMNSGVDMDMQGGVYLNYMKKSIEENKIEVARLNKAVRAILKMKFKLGLFKNPYQYCNESLESQVILNSNHLEIARDAARKSMVLLKNENELLPLNKNKKIALIGPLADDEYHLLGSWIARGDRKGVAVSVKEAFEDKGYDFAYAKGCEIEGGDTLGFSKAIKVAKSSEVVVMVVGETERMSGEAASRTNIKLPGYQQQLIKAIKKTGKPIALVLINGRPLDLSWENSQVNSILESWFPGTSGGSAIVDVLFGDYNPSGKLTVTFPRNIGQIPLHYNMKNTGRPADIEGANERYTSKYIDVENTPLYPFGYGLSYTSFKYDKVQMSTNVLTSNSEITVKVNVSNNGKYDGEEIVQLYIKDKVASLTRPVKELKGFKKVLIKKGQTKTVEFVIKPKDLKFYKESEKDFVLEDGVFEFFIGAHSSNSFTHKFSVLTK